MLSIQADELTKCSERVVKMRTWGLGGRGNTLHEGVRIQVGMNEWKFTSGRILRQRERVSLHDK